MVTCLLPQKNLDEIDVERSNSVIRVDINLELQDSMLNSASNHYIEGIRSEKKHPNAIFVGNIEHLQTFVE